MSKRGNDDDFSTADLFDCAADYIRVHGLHKGDFVSDDGTQCCVLGAVGMARGGYPYHPSLAPGTDEYLAICAAAGVTSRLLALSKWNDAPKRTADEVIDALMEAAARLRTGEVAK